jgi:hypothetical protein
MEIHLNGYTPIVANHSYARPANGLSFANEEVAKKVESAPVTLITRLIRFTMPSQQEVIDYIVKCAKNQRTELKSLVETLPNQELANLALRDPATLSHLGRHLGLADNASPGSAYLSVKNYLVSGKGFQEYQAKNPSPSVETIEGFIEKTRSLDWGIQARFAEWDCLDLKEFDPLLKRQVKNSDTLDVFNKHRVVTYDEIAKQMRSLCAIFNDPKAYALLEDNSKGYLEFTAARTLADFSKCVLSHAIGDKLVDLLSPTKKDQPKPGCSFPNDPSCN